MNLYWKIEEAVGGGKYITWDGSFSTKQGALDEIAKIERANGAKINARAAAFIAGSYDHRRGGPARFEPLQEATNANE